MILAYDLNLVNGGIVRLWEVVGWICAGPRVVSARRIVGRFRIHLDSAAATIAIDHRDLAELLRHPAIIGEETEKLLGGSPP